MDGLELSKQALELYPELRIIIFSGFSEFEYAKEAIKLGVRNYILKPLNPDEFHNTMNEVMEDITKYNNQKRGNEKGRQLAEDHLLFLCVNGMPIENLEKQADQLVNIDFLDEFSKIMLIEYNTNFFENAPANMETELKKYLNLPIRYLNLNPQQSLLLFETGVNVDYRIVAEKLHDYLERRYNDKCYIAISSQIHGKEELSTKFQEVEQMMEKKFYQTCKAIYTAESEEDKEQEEELDDDSLVKQIYSDLKMKDVESLYHHYDLLGDKFKNRINMSQIYTKFIFSNIVKEIYSYMPQMGNKKLNQEIENLYVSNDMATVVEIVRNNIKLLEEYWKNSQPSYRGEIEAVKNYIYAHYDSDLSVDVLAAKVCLAPSYLSHIFKVETGYNLSKFIKAYRMEKAKELLENTHEKIVFICNATGFSNVSYFCQSFREYYGVSPERFRKSSE